MISERTLYVLGILVLLGIFFFIYWATEESSFFLNIFPSINKDVYIHTLNIAMFALWFVLIFAFIFIFRGWSNPHYGMKMFFVLISSFFISLILTLLYTQGNPDNLNYINDVLIALLVTGLSLFIFFRPFNSKFEYTSETDWLFLAGFLVVLIVLFFYNPSTSSGITSGRTLVQCQLSDDHTCKFSSSCQ